VLKEIELSLDENDILKKKIDEIYIEIINALISSKKIEDFEYAYNVLEQLDLKSISLTKTIFDGFMNGQNFEDYEINNIEDFNDEKKVNFNYLILEFIFKNSVYIYNVPFLLKARKLFIELIKQKRFKYIKINKKIEFIILKILDSKFYSKIYYENIYEILSEVLKNYEECFFETKIEDIKAIKDIIKNKKVDYEKYEKYFKDYEKAKKINERIPIINYIYNLENKGNLRNEKIFQKAILKLDNFEKMVKDRKIKKEYDEMMANFIKDENNNKILPKILNKNEYDYFIKYIKENINNINNNKNASEILINENKYKNIENSLLIAIKEINSLEYNKPSENKIESKNNINYKPFDTNRSSGLHWASKPKKSKKLNAFEPSINNRKDNFAFDFLKKCSIIFHTNLKGNEPYIIYDKILYGEHNVKIDYRKLLDIKYDYEHSQQMNELSENFLKLFKFLKEIEERINEEFILNYNLRIKLDIREENYNNNSDSTNNITCFYTFYDPIDNKTYKFKDINILINGTNSLINGFEIMLFEINSERYKNLEYSNCVAIYKLQSNSLSYLFEPDLSRTKDEDSIFEIIKML